MGSRLQQARTVVYKSRAANTMSHSHWLAGEKFTAAGV